MAQYWLADIPGTTISSSEGERIAVLGRTIASTSEAAVIGALAGSSNALLTFSASPSTSLRSLVTTALASGEGVTVNVANNSGYIGVNVQTSTGGTVKRYILLFSS